MYFHKLLIRSSKLNCKWGGERGLMEKKMNQNSIIIKLAHCDKITQFAGSELAKYLKMMSSDDEEVVIIGDCIDTKNINSENADFEVGLFTDFNISTERLDDLELDDAIYIEVSGSKGVIAGSNSRSVLFAVYRFLEENGCRWIRPGKDGEFVPEKDIHNLNAHVSEKAFYRFRGSSVGSYGTLENYLEKLDWFPKVGLNMTFAGKYIEFSWYGDEYNNLRRPERRSDFENRIYSEKAIEEIEKRGIICHTGGHGWISNVYVSFKEKYGDEGGKKCLAMLNGKREVSRRGLGHTELCYGNSEVREMLVQSVVDYAEKNLETKYLHYWIADGMNIECECELCRDTRPSDFYVMILNAIDEELTKKNLNTRIVFILYQVLIWPPVKERIKNPDRFIMMFAPARRDYSIPFDIDVKDESYARPYMLNNYTHPLSMKEYMSYYRGWQKVFSGEAFCFDYPMTRYQCFDLGYYGLTKVLAEDIKRLSVLGMNGSIDCQLLRQSLPTRYPQYLYSKLLWNPQYNIDKLTTEYFEGAFGIDGEKCIEYMSKLSENFSPDYFYPQNFYPGTTVPNEESNSIIIDKLKKVPGIIDDFRPIIEKNMFCDNETHRLSWYYLFIHMEIALFLSHAFRARTEGCQKVAEQYLIKVVDYIVMNEQRLQRVFDLPWFYNEMTKLIEYPGLDSFHINK
jgi:hypothetical protein